MGRGLRFRANLERWGDIQGKGHLSKPGGGKGDKGHLSKLGRIGRVHGF